MSINFFYADSPNPVTHSARDFFTTSHILLEFQRSYHEHVYPHTNAEASVFEFVFQSPKSQIGGTVVDLKVLFVKLELKLVSKSGAAKENTTETQTKRTFLFNNLGQSLFQKVEVELNGASDFSANNLHPYRSILEVDLSHERVTKEGLLGTQGRFYDHHPSDIDDETNF